MMEEPASAFAVRMNAHRQQWDGSICAQPMGWSCGAPERFREDNCEQGLSRCFHLHTFEQAEPRFYSPDNSVCQLLTERPHFLDDQILVFYGGRFRPQQGIVPGTHDEVMFGLYWIRHARIDHSRSLRQLVIEPHPDGWAMFPGSQVPMPPPRSIPGLAYLKHLRASLLERALQSALETAAQPVRDGHWSPELQQRLQHACDALPLWQAAAAEAMARNQTLDTAFSPARFFGEVPLESAPESRFRRLPVPAILQSPPERLPEASPAAVAQPPDAGADTEWPAEAASPLTPLPPLAALLPEPEGAALVTRQFDAQLVLELRVAFATKTLVILSGAPGAGKSWLASHLLDDEARERSVIVPVASTWRGREDLLGYVNPISGLFEPTGFTEFLLQAEAAWHAGDQRPRLVVFEEFNLSQPEHWLSDLLVRLEYAAHQPVDRTLTLGGAGVARHPERAAQVFLAPSLRFVATLNNDHTVKPLSSRVLDRAALIEVVSSGRAALQRAGVQVRSEIAEVIEDLNSLLAPRGAAFSVRSARSLQRALQLGQSTGLSTGQALDLVLAQEVFSRVRLLAGDPRDEQLVVDLGEWVQQGACAGLLRCSDRIAAWAEALRTGRDVFQA